MSEATITNPAAPSWQIEPLGDRAFVIAFERRVDPDINRLVRAASQRLLAAQLPGVIDVVPAFCTVAVFYRPERVLGAPPPADGRPLPRSHRPRQSLIDRITSLLGGLGSEPDPPSRVVDIPVCYGGPFGLDLAEVAQRCGLAADEVVRRHVMSPHRVYMLGFSPGFPYVGGLDPRLSLPRRSTPRTRIPAGTVAIARDQTAIYTFETPGGWNLIGRTPVALFDPAAESPCLLRQGDRLRFVAIDEDRYAELVTAAQRQS